jgi:hypothetical protein
VGLGLEQQVANSNVTKGKSDLYIWISIISI